MKVPYDTDSEYSSYALSDDDLWDVEEEDDPFDKVKWILDDAKDEAKKKVMRYGGKMCSGLDASFNRAWIDIRDGMLTPLMKNKGSAAK